MTRPGLISDILPRTDPGWISREFAALRAELRAALSTRQITGTTTPGATQDYGLTVCKPPTGDPEIDDPNIIAAIGAASANGGTVELWPGSYHIKSQITVGLGVGVVGQGGDFGDSVTTLLCTTAAAGITVNHAGPMTGGFKIDGNNIATAPFTRLAAGGSSAGRSFYDLGVWNSAQDGAAFLGAQNDLWSQCHFAGAVRDVATFDQGYAGALFSRCEFTTPGRDGLHFDSLIGGGVYGFPANLLFSQCIIEGTTVRSNVYINNGFDLKFDGCSFYSPTNPSGPSIDVVNGSAIAFVNPFIGQTGALTTTGCQGIVARNLSRVSVIGIAKLQGLDQQFVVDGFTSAIDLKADLYPINCSANVRKAQNGAFVDQIRAHLSAPTSWAGPPSDFHEVSTDSTGGTLYYTRDGHGTESYWPGTGSGAAEFSVGRLGVNVWGVTGSTKALRTGSSTTPPAPSTADGMMNVNPTTGQLEWTYGGAWQTPSAVDSHGLLAFQALGGGGIQINHWQYPIVGYGGSGGVKPPSAPTLLDLPLLGVTKCLWLPGRAGTSGTDYTNVISTPDSGINTLSGGAPQPIVLDIDFVTNELDPVSGQSQYFLMARPACFTFYLDETLTPTIKLFDTSGSLTLPGDGSLPPKTRLRLQAHILPGGLSGTDLGTIMFQTSLDGGVTWAQVGDLVTAGRTFTAWTNTSSSPLGLLVGGNTYVNALRGAVLRASLSVGGTAQADFTIAGATEQVRLDPNAVTGTPNSWTGPHSETWTIQSPQTTAPQNNWVTTSCLASAGTGGGGSGNDEWVTVGVTQMATTPGLYPAITGTLLDIDFSDPQVRLSYRRDNQLLNLAVAPTLTAGQLVLDSIGSLFYVGPSGTVTQIASP